MNTDRQVFLDNLITARTHLRGVTRVNSHDRPAGPFCLALGQGDQLSPCSITDAFVHTTPIAVLHILNVQFLESYDLKRVNQLAAQLVREVTAAISDALMNRRALCARGL